MSDYDHIMKAIMAGDTDALEEISLMIDSFPAGKDDFINRNWLTNAIDCGTLDVVSWMLKKGACADFSDDEGYAALHSAIGREKPDKYEMMRLLVEAGADINARGINDWTPAHMAAVGNDVEALKILREAGAGFTIRTRIDSYATPLEEAEDLGGSLEAVAYLRRLQLH